MSDLVEIWSATPAWWSSWMAALGRSFSDSWVISIAFDSSQIPSPWINVCIPVKVAFGIDGSCSSLESSCIFFFRYLASNFGRCENQDRSLFCFSRAFQSFDAQKGPERGDGHSNQRDSGLYLEPEWFPHNNVSFIKTESRNASDGNNDHTNAQA